MQPVTDWSPRIYLLLGISGTLELAGLAWWGLGLVALILRGKRETRGPATSTGPRPEQIEGPHRVAEILDWFPETESVFLQKGFTAIRHPILRRTVARQVTLAQAAALRQVPLDELLSALNAVIAAGRTEPAGPVPDLHLVQIGAKS
jgi:hypothetical protein